METPWAKLLQPVAGYGPPDPESALCYNATEPDAQAYDELEPSASQWPTGLRPADISQAFSMVPIYAELPAPAQQQDAGGASDPATPPPSSPAAAVAAAWQAADAAWRPADAPSVQQPLAISAAAPDAPPTRAAAHPTANRLLHVCFRRRASGAAGAAVQAAAGACPAA